MVSLLFKSHKPFLCKRSRPTLACAVSGDADATISFAGGNAATTLQPAYADLASKK